MLCHSDTLLFIIITDWEKPLSEPIVCNLYRRDGLGCYRCFHSTPPARVEVQYNNYLYFYNDHSSQAKTKNCIWKPSHGEAFALSRPEVSASWGLGLSQIGRPKSSPKSSLFRKSPIFWPNSEILPRNRRIC